MEYNSIVICINYKKKEYCNLFGRKETELIIILSNSGVL